MEQAKIPYSLFRFLALVLLAATVAGPRIATAGDALARGNEAFQAGRFEEAAKIYEAEEDDADLLVRRFNAGVSWARTGTSDKASERFEDVASRAQGELRGAGLYNAGHAAFTRGKTMYQEALKKEDPEERLKELGEAAKTYHSALQFFRSVDPPDGDVLENLGVVKTALRAAVDAIARIEEEKRKQAEEEALRSPPELLRALLAKERMHRSLARGLLKEPAQRLRLASRRLRKSEAESRALAEKLHHGLTASPPAPAQPPPGAPQPGQAPPGPSEEEEARNGRAAEAVARAIEAQKTAEVAYSTLDLAGAIPAHTRAVADLRAALEAFPLDVAAVIGDAISGQEAVNGAMDALSKQAAGSTAGAAGAGTGIGQKVVDAIKDAVLLPLARLLSPKSLEDAKALADDEDDVTWGSGIIAQAEIKPPEAPPPPPPGAPQPPPAPQLTPEKAKELTEGLQRQGKAALEASTRAKESLAKGELAPAVPEGEKALAALERAADLLPKPPEPPEVRLRKLIERQKEAEKAVAALPGLDEAGRGAAAGALAKTQRADGKEAGGIAEELEKRPARGPEDPAKPAAVKVREGEREVFSSAEALDRSLADPARQSIERDVKAFEEALALLSGKKPQDKEQDQGDQDQKKQEEDQGQKNKEKRPSPDKKKQENKPYKLSARDARLKQREMDRKRQEEEAKIFAAPSGLTVEKDW